MNLLFFFRRYIPNMLLKELKWQTILIFLTILLLVILCLGLHFVLLIFFSQVITERPILVFSKSDEAVLLHLLFVNIVLNKVFQLRILDLTYDLLYSFELSIIRKLYFGPCNEFKKIGRDKWNNIFHYIRFVSFIPGAVIYLFCAIFNIVAGVVFLLISYYYDAKTWMFAILVFVIIFIVGRMVNHIDQRIVRPDSFSIKNRFYLKDELEMKFVGCYIMGAFIFLFPDTFWINTKYEPVVLVVVLFLAIPTNKILPLLPWLISFREVVGEVKKFSFGFTGINPVLLNRKTSRTPAFHSLRLEGIVYQYVTVNGFKTKSVSIEINANEIIFVTGSNESSISAFIKILMGEHRPICGNMYLDGNKIDITNNQLSNLITFHKQDSNFFIPSEENYSLTDGKQLERLNLFYQLLQYNPIIILDSKVISTESGFSGFFYEQLLDLIREQKKTIVVIGYDESYSYRADKILQFDSCKMNSFKACPTLNHQPWF